MLENYVQERLAGRDTLWAVGGSEFRREREGVGCAVVDA
jgi:hypothetical protein